MSAINWNKLGAIIGLTALGITSMVIMPNEALVGAIVGFVGGVLVANGALKVE